MIKVHQQYNTIMQKASNKIPKQQSVTNSISLIPNSQLPHSPKSYSSLSSASKHFKLYNKMHKSLKTSQPQQKIKTTKSNQQYLNNAIDKLKTFSYLSQSKGKKISQSYYYRNQNKNKVSDSINKTKDKNKDKDNLSKKIGQNQARILNYKQSKSKLQTNIRKNQKSKLFTKPITSSFESNARSLKRLISSTQVSQNITKLHTIRTLSPQIELISEQLQQNKKQKLLKLHQAQLFQRMTNILQQYRQVVVKQQKEKQILTKQNRKLKQKLQSLNYQKKYKPIKQYNM